MKKIIVAIGLKNDNELTDKHFGDSNYFDIYELAEGSSMKKIKRIENVKVKEEKIHGDPKKAKVIENILNETDVLVAFRMGPNILRMKKKFVPVIVPFKELDMVKPLLVENFDVIFKETCKDGEKNYNITLKPKEA